MTKRLAILLAIKAFIQAALPEDVLVLGLENSGAAPDRIPVGGRVVIRAGDPGDPEIDLSPVTYHYSHQIPLEIVAPKRSEFDLAAEELVDTIVASIGAAIKADRTVGGAVDYIDGFSPATDDLFVPGSDLARTADLVLVATYATEDPL